MSAVYGRALRAIHMPPHPERRHAMPEPELHGRTLFQTRIDREEGALWLKESLDDDHELGPYDANAFEVAYPNANEKVA